jgi:transcription antitermination protein NusB
LLQSLYARCTSGFWASLDAPFFDDADRIDQKYAESLEKIIIRDEGKILSVVYECAPKYDIKSVAIVNALILMIALAEILVLHPDDVPERVSVDEAIELAKRYSDDAGKNFINGVLNSVLQKKKELIEWFGARKSSEYSFFAK